MRILCGAMMVSAGLAGLAGLGRRAWRTWRRKPPNPTSSACSSRTAAPSSAWSCKTTAGRRSVARQCQCAGHAQTADRRLGRAMAAAPRSRRWRPSRRRPSRSSSSRRCRRSRIPSVLLNAAVNYSEHGMEMTGQATVAASADKVDPKVAHGHSRLLEPQARRSAAEPVLLHEGASAITGQRRSDHPAARAARRSTGSASSTS